MFLTTRKTVICHFSMNLGQQIKLFVNALGRNHVIILRGERECCAKSDMITPPLIMGAVSVVHPPYDKRHAKQTTKGDGGGNKKS